MVSSSSSLFLKQQNLLLVGSLPSAWIVRRPGQSWDRKVLKTTGNTRQIQEENLLVVLRPPCAWVVRRPAQAWDRKILKTTCQRLKDNLLLLHRNLHRLQENLLLKLQENLLCGKFRKFLDRFGIPLVYAKAAKAVRLMGSERRVVFGEIAHLPHERRRLWHYDCGHIDERHFVFVQIQIVEFVQFRFR